jgi:DNA repair protein RecN (Recombination protein N)
MLRQLSIKNYATVDTLDIEFQPGMSVITGETGAGKSIILGALGLTLGDRADKTIVRSGASKADICAEFDIARIKAAKDWLQDHDLDEESPVCLLRRIVGDDGRSKGYINGSPVTMGNLQELGEMLIDIHSQHEHQSLLHRGTHQRLLDEFCVESALLGELADTFRQWQRNAQRMQELSERSEENSAQIQLLSYQLSELDEMAIGADEVATLEAEFKILNNADESIGAVQAALTLCSEDEEHNLSSLLNQTLGCLAELPDTDPRINTIRGLLETANIQLEEAISELRAFADGFEADPQRLEQINARLADLHSLARKHKVKPSDLTRITEELRAQLSEFENSDEELARLAEQDKAMRKTYQSLAVEVSKQRQAGAKKLSKQVNAQLKQLGMPNASLEVKLGSLDSSQPSLHGKEWVEFLVSTNPGQEAKPLIKIASGGELSRISLAIQVITAQTSHVPSLVFDEVDVGIGGGVARTVGELMRALGKTTQILCVTHQAQVAGQGHHHFFVSKSSDKKSTLTRIVALDEKQKVREVARMLGGEELSEESLAHAEQMVASN